MVSFHVKQALVVSPTAIAYLYIRTYIYIHIYKEILTPCLTTWAPFLLRSAVAHVDKVITKRGSKTIT